MNRDRPTVHAARLTALAFVADALRDAGVPFFVVPAYTGDAERVGVLVSRRHEAEDALRRADDGTWRVRERPAVVGSSALPLTELRTPATPSAWSIFRPREWADAWFRLGPDAGVPLEFWSETDDSWEAPARNPVACMIPPAGQRAATVDVGGRAYPTVTALAQSPWDDLAEPVDVVYTWVDGNDQEWRQRRKARLAEVGGPAAVPVESRARARFADHGELRYSLRALEQFMPWVRTVHLVTADQRPDWLVADHPRLHVVSHRDILDADALPTFNSLAIETSLHRIDGLADRYLYLNDDVFVGRPVRAIDFFAGNGVSKFFPQPFPRLDPGPWSATDPSYLGAEKRTRDLLAERFGRRVSTLIVHAPHPQQRAVLEEVEATFPVEVAATRRSPFRHPDNVTTATSMHHFFAYFTGRSTPAQLGYTGLRLAGEDLRERLRELGRARPQAFCLNDTVDGALPPGRKAKLVTWFLDKFLPEPSSFER